MTTRLRLPLLLAVAGLLAVTISGRAQQVEPTAKTNAEPVLLYDFKQHFVTPLKAPIDGNFMNAVASGAVRIETNDCYAKPNALRLDCTGHTGNVVVVNFMIPGDKLAAFKGKPLVFRAKAKVVKGSGALSARMRCFGGGKYLMGTATSFQGEKGKWQPFELRCTIPRQDAVEGVDFHLGVPNSADPVVVILDECALFEDVGESGPAARGFLAMEPDPAAPLELVRDGKPVAVIVTEEKPTPTVSFAVQELCEHVELATGAKLQVVKDGEPVSGPAIHIGKTALTQRLGVAPEFLAPDQWLVFRVDQALVLSGGDNRDNLTPVSRNYVPFGSLYAVYEFLERDLGVRWYWPGDLGRVVPKRASLAVVNPQLQGAPSYDTRTVAFVNHSTSEYSRVESQIWGRRQRIGGIGGDPIANHSFTHWDKKYGKEHPDWFALRRDGTRYVNPGNGGHLCFTHPDVFKTVVAEKRKIFDDTPWLRYSSVMPGDSDEYCRCERCQALVRPQDGADSASFAIWSFVNKVAAEVRKTHPDRFITCASYGLQKKIPADVVMEPNVAVTVCDSTFPGYIFAPDAKGKYVKRLKEIGLQAANLYVWDYWLTRWTLGDLSLAGAPAIYPHAIKEWWLLDYGRARGHMIELPQLDHDGKDIGAWADWLLDSLNVYVGLRLLWNMDQDVDAILDEFYREFYGPAGPTMKQFYGKLEAAFLDPDTKGGPQFGWNWEICWLKTYPAPFVAETMGLLRRAVEETEGQEPYQARARKTLEAYLPFEEGSRRFSVASSKPVENTEIAVPMCATAPAVDANPDDACWKDAATASGFVEFFNLAERPAKTEVRMVRDAQTLYVAIRAELPSGQCHILFPDGGVDGNVWDQESVELFFVHGDRKYQFLIGPDNVYADNVQPDRNEPFNMDMFLWNCAGVKYRTGRTDKGWTAELAIPLASLDLPLPGRDDPWRVNFGRNYYYRPTPGVDAWKDETSTWRPTFGSFHNVERFGELFFK